MSSDGSALPVGESPRLEAGKRGRDELDVVRRLGRDSGPADSGVDAQSVSDDAPGGLSDGEPVDPSVVLEGSPGVEGDDDSDGLVVGESTPSLGAPLTGAGLAGSVGHGPMVTVKASDGTPRTIETEPAWEPTPEKPVPQVRCTWVDMLTGVLCGECPRVGSTVGKQHAEKGGFGSAEDYAEAVVHGARNRIMGIADDAVSVLADLMVNSHRDQVRVAAATAVQDRAGIRPGSDVKIEATVEVGRSPAEIVAERMARVAALPAHPAEAIEDAEEPEDEDVRD